MQDLTTTFAGYQLHEVLGTDAASTLYRATTRPRDTEHAGAPVTVALRVSHVLDSDTDRRHARVFERRATAAMDLDHPGVERVLDAGSADDRVYAATAWRASITLDELIGQQWQLTTENALELLAQLAAGLDAAHAAGIVHGALGVDTMRIDAGGADGRGDAFVTGFGLDALLAPRLGSKRNRDNGALHSELLYVAPEQLRGGVAVAATDQYALACALYHCVSGRPPFVRDTAAALVGAHLFARPDVTDTFADPSNQAVRAAAATGLSKEPQARHRSCAQLLAAARKPRSNDAHRFMTPAVAGPTAASGTTVGRDQVSTTNGGTTNGHTSVATSERLAAFMRSGSDRLLAYARPALAAGRSTMTPARSAGTAAASRLRELPPAVAPVLALIAGIIVAVAIVMMLGRGDATAASDDAPPNEQVPAVNAAAEPDGGAQQPEPDGQAELPEPQPATVVEWSQPAVDAPVASMTANGDTLVVGTDDEIVALDRASGATRWRHTVDDGAVTSSVATDDALVYRSSELHALALADGTRLWSRSDQFTPIGSLAAVPGGLLYGTGPGRIIPEIMALDPASGEEQWHFHGEAVDVKKNAASAVADDFVAILQRGTLFAIDPNGELGPSGENRIEVEEELWLADIDRPWNSSVMLTDDAVLLATRNGEVCSYSRTDGVQRWCRSVAGVADRQPTLTADDERVIVTTESTIAALDAVAGTSLWQTTAGSTIVAATGDPDRVVVGDAAGTIRSLDPTSGRQRWRLEDQPGVTSLTVVDDAVYAGTRDGAVLRVRPNEVGSAP